METTIKYLLFNSKSMEKVWEIFHRDARPDLKAAERADKNYLGSRYAEYMANPDVQKDLHHPLDFEKLSRFLDIDLPEAVKEYRSSGSQNAGGHNLDMILFTRIADAFLDWMDDYEKGAGKEAGNNAVDSIDIRRSILAIRDMMRVDNKVTAEDVVGIISMVDSAYAYQELRRGNTGASAFLDEPRSRMPQFFDERDTHIMYNAIIKKYSLKKEIMPQGYGALADMASAFIDRRKHPNLDPKKLDFQAEGLPFDTKIGICFMHQYVKVLNATELSEKIDDSTMISENEVPKSVVEGLNRSMAKLVAAFAERLPAQGLVEQQSSVKDLSIYG